tara:strand:+ start:2978 stop:3610 length:633 start_codon:yes stop_codon:yes gene_type:complete
MIWYVIPARQGSKGFPLKNRKLFDSTINSIPEYMRDQTIVTSDDQEILKKAELCGAKILSRSKNLATDEISIKNVMLDVVQKFNMDQDDIVIMLYLTYPERTWKNIEDALKYFKTKKINSLLCSKKTLSHPYLCMFSQEGNKGTQVIKHDLYRRQDYPECFEISHFICAFRVFSLNTLNNNMYNDHTVFYPIENVIDVDTPYDFMKWKKR